MQGVPSPPTGQSPLVVDRYAIYDAIASGGMATVHLGRLVGPAGFSRTVAIKRLHPQFAHDQDFKDMFLDEARLAARVQHPNVVPTLDVVPSEHELLLVMEYVRGESLGRLLRTARERGERLPPRIAVAILSGALQGLHAAHEAMDEKGRPLGLVHRDMSPQNILVGVDGTARVLDFGVAKAEGRMHTTQEGQVKGKLMYMPPEQLGGHNVSRTADVYSMGVVVFETLTGVRMFAGANDAAAITRIVNNDIRVPSEIVPDLGSFDGIVRRATAADPLHRFPTARAMAFELESVVTPASPAEVGEWVERLAGGTLDDRARKVAEIESSTMSVVPIRMPVAPTESSSSRIQPVTHVQSSQPDRRRTALLAGAGALLLGLVGIVAYAAGNREHEGSRPEPTSAVASAVAPPASPPVVAAPPPTTPLEKPPPEPTPSVAAPAVTRPVVTATVPPPTAKTAPAAPKSHCNPPYTVDKQGHKHFLPECVQ